MSEINGVHVIEQPKRGPKLKYKTLEERKEAQLAYRVAYYQNQKKKKQETEALAEASASSSDPQPKKKRGAPRIYATLEDSKNAQKEQMKKWRESIRF
jgi:hypothetical protein